MCEKKSNGMRPLGVIPSPYSTVIVVKLLQDRLLWLSQVLQRYCKSTIGSYSLTGINSNLY